MGVTSGAGGLCGLLGIAANGPRVGFGLRARLGGVVGRLPGQHLGLGLRLRLDLGRRLTSGAQHVRRFLAQDARHLVGVETGQIRSTSRGLRLGEQPLELTLSLGERTDDLGDTDQMHPDLVGVPTPERVRESG